MHDHTTILEEWRPVVGYEGFYEVSNLGRVKSLWSGLILKTSSQKYPDVGLSNGREFQRTHRVHILVSAAWLPPRPSPAHEVNHIDGDKAHNCAENLEWATRQQNIAHARRTGLMPSRKGKWKARLLTYEKAQEIRALAGTMPYSKIAAMYETSIPTVSGIVRNKRWVR